MNYWGGWYLLVEEIRECAAYMGHFTSVCSLAMGVFLAKIIQRRVYFGGKSDIFPKSRVNFIQTIAVDKGNKSTSGSSFPSKNVEVPSTPQDIPVRINGA